MAVRWQKRNYPVETTSYIMKLVDYRRKNMLKMESNEYADYSKIVLIVNDWLNLTEDFEMQMTSSTLRVGE